MPVVIYALCDESGEVFYVGRTTDPAQRLLAHLAPNSKTAAHARIEALRAAGQQPTMQLLETIADDAPAWRAASREHYWIGVYAAQGAPLVNKQVNPRKAVSAC